MAILAIEKNTNLERNEILKRGGSRNSYTLEMFSMYGVNARYLAM